MSAVNFIYRIQRSAILSYSNLQQLHLWRVCLPTSATTTPTINTRTITRNKTISARCMNPSNYNSWKTYPALSTRINTLNYTNRRTDDFSTNNSNQAGKSDSKSSAAITEADLYGDTSKLSIFAKFKLMYKKYWYVLLPVHIITSVGWFGGFYYLSKSGVDISALLDFLHFNDAIIEKIKNSDKLGHVAIAYLCYKLATPLRYAVTLGGTTVSIKYLVQAGHIKPMPTKDEIVRMYEKKRAIRAAAKKAENNNK